MTNQKNSEKEGTRVAKEGDITNGDDENAIDDNGVNEPLMEGNNKKDVKYAKMLHNWEYFGTYLGYLPTIPTSPHCDTLQLIPASFLGCLGHFPTSSAVELVSFSLVSS